MTPDQAPNPAIYRATLKDRKTIEAEIPPEKQHWWAVVCPGAVLTLRDATAADIERCWLGRPTDSRDPADYLCEIGPRGALVDRIAVAHMVPLSNNN